MSVMSEVVASASFASASFASTRVSTRRASRAVVAGLVAAAVLVGAAEARSPHKQVAAAPAAEGSVEAVPGEHHPVSRFAGRYFVDFRARTAASYGHAFIWYGRLNAQGKVGLVDVAGLHPASDSPIPYVIGHVFPVPSETGKSYGDLDEEYLTASYRVYLSEPDAKRVFAYIRRKQESSPVWIAGVYNCTAFIADIANYMGLKAPVASTWMYPEDMVNSLKEMNGGRQEVALAPPEKPGFDLSAMLGSAASPAPK